MSGEQVLDKRTAPRVTALVQRLFGEDLALKGTERSGPVRQGPSRLTEA